MRAGHPGVGHGFSMGVPSFCVWVCVGVSVDVKRVFFVVCVFLCFICFALLCVWVCVWGARGTREASGVVIGWIVCGVALLFLF